MIKRLCAVLALTMVTAGSAILTAAPASASVVRTDPRTTWAYTDARAPFRSFVDTANDAPVGVWRDTDRKLHFSKSYFTFDLDQLRSARIFRATAFTAETQANDCTTERATQLWLTDIATQPTFARAPKELARWDTGSGGPCLTARVEWDVTDGLRQAVAAEQARVTVAMRLADDWQFDVRFGRRYANDLRLTIEYNLPPSAPVDLTTDQHPCAGGPLVTRNQNPEIAARISDPNGDNVFARFAWWAVDTPEARTERATLFRPSGSVHSALIPPSALEHGRTYQWQVRAEDGVDVSAWSAPCQFSTDFVAPEVAPTISSTVFTEDCFPSCPQVGVPGDFTFTANGATDVVGFIFGQSEFPGTFVAADRPGGQATINFTPRFDGPQSMFAQSVDAAGNKSALSSYGFFVDS